MRDPKRKYIEATYQLIQSEGYENLSIRKLASYIGCSAPAIYKHFPDFNELLSIASIRFLHDYVEDARTLSRVDLNPLELNLQLWECLAFYSFQQAPVFEHLFFSDGAKGAVHNHYVKYYSQCFPEEFDNLKDFMLDMFSTADIFERNAILLYRAADKGMLSYEAAQCLRDVDVYIYRGMLASLRNSYQNKEIARQAIGHFMKMTITNYQSYLNSDFSILAVEPGLSALHIDRSIHNSRTFHVVSSKEQATEVSGNQPLGENNQSTQHAKMSDITNQTEEAIRQRVALTGEKDFIHPLFSAGTSAHRSSETNETTDESVPIE